MKIRTVLRHAIAATAISMVATTAFASPAPPGHRTDDAWLRQALIAREGALTHAYNTCNLHALRASLFAGTALRAPDGRHIDPVIDARDRVCGRLHRQVMPGSLSVRGMGDDSALVNGTQCFCAINSVSCSTRGERFVHLWTLDHGLWRMSLMLHLDATR
ncbi:nuclear transport factor 2 family protein [Rhodanobacter denitrificans]|uniref:Nuclear transport factor 2 family protein n=1 Tax=Rhodanobacter denitrificans TaxID=666685 RepID=A0A368KI56_9GAMM|nr:nuclear transport factor 2 family protein [Rhodanobacter denitrificans]RCS30655.1 nuclear transport factor 2 family protein [Rhodanobacter denitrificans]